MIDAAEASLQFDAAFAALAPTGLAMRPEADADAAFLRALFLASYPLRDILPEPVLSHQVELRLANFRQGFSGAMRRIVVGPEGPVGRIIVDWDHRGAAHCVDIAVAPARGRQGVGTALLNAWIEVAQANGLSCTLTVAADNPARALYARLGFHDMPEQSGLPGELGVGMARPPRR